VWKIERNSQVALKVYLEVGSKRVFACALDWPGWCRSGKNEEEALESLLTYAPRYETIVRRAGRRFPARLAPVAVLERVRGGSTTDFGAPEKAVRRDGEVMTKPERSSQAALLQAAWAEFDDVVAGAPASLRKGPRGGGRDRDAMAQHVVSAEAAYARKLGIKVRAPHCSDRGGVDMLRRAIVEVVSSTTRAGPLVEKGWPLRYGIRRVAWHVLDHTWEIEDRSTPAKSPS
jgi:hypothetical protein